MKHKILIPLVARVFISALCIAGRGDCVFAQDADALSPELSLDAAMVRSVFSQPVQPKKDPIMIEIVHDLKNKAIAPVGFSSRILRKFPDFEGAAAVQRFYEVTNRIQNFCLQYLTRGADFSDDLWFLENEAAELRVAKDALMTWNSVAGKEGDYIRLMTKGADEMQEKIFSLLNWTGRSTDWFDVADFFNGMAAGVNVPGIEVRVELSDDVAALAGVPVFTYKGILRTATDELVKNAIKYSGSKEINILVSLTEDHSELEVTVRDYGKGISPEALARLEAGIPVGTEAKTSSVGTGNGLYTLKNALETVGGTLHASSGNGITDFRFSLPLEAPMDGIHAAPRTPSAIVVCGLGGSGRRVMSHWLAAKLHLRYINSGFLPRMIFYKLLEEKDALHIDLNDEHAVTRYFEQFLAEGRVDYSTEPVKLDGVDTAMPDSEGMVLREKIKMRVNGLENRDMFYRVANYPSVITVLNNFFARLTEDIRAAGKYNGVVIKSTEPFPAGFTNIMLSAPSTVRAQRLQSRREVVEEMDVKTGQHDFLRKFSSVQRFETYDDMQGRDVLPRTVGEHVLRYLTSLSPVATDADVCQRQASPQPSVTEKSI